MNKPLINLEKERDFTDVINTTFSFIKQEFKPLMKTVLLCVGLPIIIASSFAAIYSQNAMANMFDALQGNTIANPQSFTAIVFGLVANLLMGIVVMFLSGLVASYLAEYRDKGHNGFVTSDVWRRFVSKLGTFILFSIVSSIIIIVGFLLCLVPGIYLMVPLSLGISIIYLENTNLSQTFDRSFRLVKNNWWNTFGLILTVMIIISVLSALLSLPTMIIALVKGLTASTGGDSTMGSTLPIVITTVVASIVQYLLYIMFYVAVGIQYFNLKEIKDQTSLFQKVSEITNE